MQDPVVNVSKKVVPPNTVFNTGENFTFEVTAGLVSGTADEITLVDVMAAESGITFLTVEPRK